MTSTKPRITIRVSKSEMEELQKIADKEYRTVPALVLTLVKRFLEEQASKQ